MYLAIKMFPLDVEAEIVPARARVGGETIGNICGGLLISPSYQLTASKCGLISPSQLTKCDACCSLGEAGRLLPQGGLVLVTLQRRPTYKNIRSNICRRPILMSLCS